MIPLDFSLPRAAASAAPTAPRPTHEDRLLQETRSKIQAALSATRCNLDPIRIEVPNEMRQRVVQELQVLGWQIHGNLAFFPTEPKGGCTPPSGWTDENTAFAVHAQVVIQIQNIVQHALGEIQKHATEGYGTIYIRQIPLDSLGALQNIITQSGRQCHVELIGIPNRHSAPAIIFKIHVINPHGSTDANWSSGSELAEVLH